MYNSRRPRTVSEERQPVQRRQAPTAIGGGGGGCLLGSQAHQLGAGCGAPPQERDGGSSGLQATHGRARMAAGSAGTCAIDAVAASAGSVRRSDVVP
jgi:hypothetical protein